ncbi:hypothetical protein ACVWZM_002936 [Bradyrhizobium sp. USDA 4501]
MEDSDKVSTVSADARYLAAWSEVTARITQRQNALYIFMATSGVIIGFAFSMKGFPVGARALVLLAVPLTAYTMALLNEKHNQTIALLRSFLALCEKSSDKTTPSLRDISYNWHIDFREAALAFRRYHDRAFAIAIAVLCTIGLLTLVVPRLASKGFPTNLSDVISPGFIISAAVYLAIYLMSSIVAMLAVWRTAVYELESPIERRRRIQSGF